MADSVVHMGENTPEQVAFKLMRLVAQAEKVNLDNSMNINSGREWINSSREWIIRTYCTCLTAVEQPAYPEDALKLGAMNSNQ